jgi:hypothetical protein
MPIDRLEVIAEREFDLAHGGTEQVVLLRIGKPVPDPEPGGDWACPIQLIGLDDDSVQLAYGVDSLQAVLLAIQLAGVLLERGPHAGEKLSWLGQTDLGLSTHSS